MVLYPLVQDVRFLAEYSPEGQVDLARVDLCLVEPSHHFGREEVVEGDGQRDQQESESYKYTQRAVNHDFWERGSSRGEVGVRLIYGFLARSLLSTGIYVSPARRPPADVQIH